MSDKNWEPGERARVMDALGIEYDEVSRTYWVLGKFAAYECDSLWRAAQLAREAPERRWYRPAQAIP